MLYHVWLCFVPICHSWPCQVSGTAEPGRSLIRDECAAFGPDPELASFSSVKCLISVSCDSLCDHGHFKVLPTKALEKRPQNAQLHQVAHQQKPHICWLSL